VPRKSIVVFIFMLFALISVVPVGAEDQLGVAIYPGASLDAATTKFLKESLKVNGVAYRTNDPLAKVADFYKSQKTLEVIDILKEGALFRKDSVDVTLQSPWMDMKTGKMNNDTLISIVAN